ncbi:RraA family protein [Elioraea rosea]|uniref:RraA family protein n=1 Tax=Elioraea rosea TaxID=2492390 RepID=UPI001184EB20|nr:RraA family protein [Elioraea rosea]
MIDDPPLLAIRRGFARPDREAMARLGAAPTGNLADALGGRAAMRPVIKPVVSARQRFAGVALTCFCGPGDNLAVMGALSIAEPGDVIVAAADGFADAAICGDVVAGIARNRGVAAFVTDGAVRDLDGLDQVGLPVFAASVTPDSCARSGPGTVGLPVVCGGVTVHPGDIVVGDRDGVVVIPAARIAEALEALARVQEAEAAILAEVAAGLAEPLAIAALAARNLIRSLD